MINAADEQRGPMGKVRGIMENMTDEQKACIKEQGCEIQEMKDMGKKMVKQMATNDDEKPQMPKMTDEEKAKMDANRECMQAAFKTCGIKMPEPPQGKQNIGAQQGTRKRSSR